MGNSGFDAVVVERVSGFVGGHVGVLGFGTQIVSCRSARNS